MLKLDPRTAHDILLHDFAVYLRDLRSSCERYAVGSEVKWRKHRFDIVAVRVNIPSDRAVYAFEVKVSADGVRQELRSGKWKAMTDAGAAPYFVVPQGVASKVRDILPAEIGLVERLVNGEWCIWGNRLSPRVDKPDVSELLIATFCASVDHYPLYARHYRDDDAFECAEEPLEADAVSAATS
jgi:hypothetical protein